LSVELFSCPLSTDNEELLGTSFILAKPPSKQH
jgi:hypothetical protein